MRQLPKRRLIVCPHCGNKTPHTMVFSYTFAPKEAPDIDLTYYLLKCSTCEDLSLYSALFDEWDEATLEHPKGAELHYSVPVIVRDCYAEAKRVQKVAPNAFAVMIRRALEAICNDRDVGGGVLQKRLEELSQKGEIPPKLAEMTEVLRVLGNVGAHKTSQSVTVSLTRGMDDFFRAVVEYVYVAPSKLNEFKKNIEKYKLKP